MQNAYPPIPRSEIIIAQMALDTAIEQVEADAVLVALERSVEHVEWDGAPTVPDTAVEHVEEHARPYQCGHPNPVAPASLIPSRVSAPLRRPANQNVDRRGSLSGIPRLFRWRPTRSIEVNEDEEAGRDTWLTELLERTSREEDEDYQDFTPKRAQAATSTQADVAATSESRPPPAAMTRAYLGGSTVMWLCEMNLTPTSNSERHTSLH
jgi:hypothetical protein